MPHTSVSNLLKQKRKAKKDLAKKLSFSDKRPLLGIFLDRELSCDHAEMIKAMLSGVRAIGFEIVVLADSNLETFSIPNIIILPYSRMNRKTLLESADMALGFEFNDIEELLINGVIPISPTRSEVKDYNPNHETGNSFIYKQNDPWYMFAAIVRARETFKFPYDWKNIVREGLVSVGNNF
ncbi:MAG: hypothetical protein ABIH78_04230 [Candidatus Peregrinibacteria bacterium]